MTIRLGPGLLFLVLAGCASAPGPRLAGASPNLPTAQPTPILLAPSPSWPVRWSLEGPERPSVAATAVWTLPSQDAIPVLAFAPASSQPIPALPLPALQPLPLKETPRSRSWTPVTQAKPVGNLPVPTQVSSSVTKAETKAESKPAATTPAKPAPVPAKASPTPTAAATANLLPTDQGDGSDFRWEDVNASAGDAVTLHFDKTNWLYLDSPAQQKQVGFLSISRDKDATTFQFKPLLPGQYTLEFQRQDLTKQTTETRKVRLTVVKPGTKTASGSPLTPQVSSTSAGEALEASRQLAAAGKTAEAVQRLLQSYKADDARLNLELGRLLNQSGQDDEALTYLDKNLTLEGPDIQATWELGTKLATTRDPQKKLPPYVKLWTSGNLVPSEALYHQVFETLRQQKMGALLKDWSGRYAGWYPAPQSRDRYLYQLAQWLEEPGDYRDIRGSWKAYNEVVQSYPLSTYWKPAGERAAYLNRHFLQVR